MNKTKFIITEGMDRCGKSTFIKKLINHDIFESFGRFNRVKELKFPKVLPLSGKLLRINDEKSFELLFTVFGELDTNTTYILDRFIMSNLVYDKVLRGEDTLLSEFYYDEFKAKFNVLEILLTRPHIAEDFVDDKISMSREKFNLCLDEYKKYGTNHQLLIDENGVLTEDKTVADIIFKKCDYFIRDIDD